MTFASLLSFLKVAAKDIRVGAVMPSSRAAVVKVLAAMPQGFSRVLEYGPGDGVITKALLAPMPHDGRLVAIETNERFVAGLRQLGDARLIVVAGTAADAAAVPDVRAAAPFDAVVSGIPFSLFSDAERRRVVEMTEGLLRPGGVFVVYQVSPLMARYLRERFEVTTRFEWRNVPPYFIMAATKK